MALGEISGKIARYRFGYEEGRFSIFAGTEKLKDIPLISTRDPVREGQRHVGAFRLKPGMLALVCGVAHLPLLEILAEQLLTREGRGGIIVAFEADSTLYLALKKLRPEIFENIAVILPENEGVVEELVEQLDVENFLGYRTFENRPSLDLEPKFYQDILLAFKKKLSSRFSDLFTRLEFEERWVYNSLSKIPALGHARPVSALFGQAKGQRVVIVSTGPTLRDLLPELRKIQHDIFIACADSAYRVLVRAGITPHLVFSLDSQAHTAKHFGLLPKGQVGQYPILVCDLVSNPWVVRNWLGELAFSITAQYPDNRRIVSPGCDYLEDSGILGDQHGIMPGDLQSGGSVATSIFDLVRLMEFDEIVLAGQDLAYTRREIHTPGTHHTEEWLARQTNRLQPLENINERVLHRRHTKREKSLAGNMVVSDYVLSLYRDWFANAITRLQTPVHNATKDGLEIPGTIRAMEIGTGTNGLNARIKEKYLAAPKISVAGGAVDKLRKQVTAAMQGNIDNSGLTFLRYVGRKFAIKAMRSPETAKRILARQSLKQKYFLRKVSTKLIANG